ncbi:DUF7522 family protein [Haloparvum sp. PAK95]|uniref:DUF7522 family protein n=1 Tax=Haloparvum sp. PAK95 TaxID=3418962 RepID=UPI003D2F0C97
MADPTSQVVDACRYFGGERLRDIWIFDGERHASLFLRDDVAATIDDVDVSQYVDVERYGYVTRESYEDLHYAEYWYTVRGFDEYDQYRTFFGEGTDRVGLFASFDSHVEPCDFRALTESLEGVVDPAGLAAALDAESDD